jgi:hypothetical protein
MAMRNGNYLNDRWQLAIYNGEGKVPKEKTYESTLSALAIFGDFFRYSQARG